MTIPDPQKAYLSHNDPACRKTVQETPKLGGLDFCTGFHGNYVE